MGLFFVADVDVAQARAGIGEGVEVGREGDAGQLAFEVGLVALAVDGVMQQAVDVVEDIPLGDGVIAVVGAEAVQRPGGDVFAAVAAVLVVGVVGEALGLFKGQGPGKESCLLPDIQRFSITKASNTDDAIL